MKSRPLYVRTRAGGDEDSVMASADRASTKDRENHDLGTALNVVATRHRKEARCWRVGENSNGDTGHGTFHEPAVGRGEIDRAVPTREIAVQ